MQNDKKFRRSTDTLKEFEGGDFNDSHGSYSESEDASQLSQSGFQDNTVAVPTSSPTHLLLVALLEHLCSMYVSDKAKSNQLFKVLCQQLVSLGVMSPVGAIDEISAIRSQYVYGFSNLIKAAMTTINLNSRSVGRPGISSGNLRLMLQPRADVGRELPSEDVFGFHTSRYSQEFIEMGFLGTGAYGTVFKAQHKLDGCQYAVKKISFHRNKAEVWVKVIREVKCLAALNHRSIVRYHGAWLEYEMPFWPENGVADKKSMKALAYEISNGKKEEESVDIVFESSQKSNKTSSSGDDKHIAESRMSWETSIPAESLIKPRVVLYIQMELCMNTLKDWISLRNARLTPEVTDVYDKVEVAANLKILKQILHAVVHIHSCGLIHRDLKPKNIFLGLGRQGQLEAKIGDFGLARFQDINEPLTPSPGVNNASGEGPVEDGLYTSGVGTTIYAAPEQLSGTAYDSKCDMYSLGVIIYELYQPFRTEMERVSCLRQLPQSALPAEFVKQWPTEARHITTLLQADPALRPSAEDLLNSELFCTKDQMIEHLQHTVDRQSSDIASLSDQLRQKDKLLLQKAEEIERKDKELEILRAELEMLRLSISR